MSLKITILGSGNMGTALAHLVGVNGHQVKIWGIEADVIKDISHYHENKKYLPKVKLSARVQATLDLGEALAGSKAMILAVPTQAARSVAEKALAYLASDVAVLNVAKGLDLKSGETVSQILSHSLPRSYHEKTAVLMGPLFASEISAGMPSVGILASKEAAGYEFWQRILVNKYFFLRHTDDILGAELGGALKNVYAILLGVCDGLGYGWNTKSAVFVAVTRELAMIGHYLGGRKETLYGLAGLGDLLTTGFGSDSRNRRFGEKLCSGKSIPEIIKEIGQVVEGAATVKVAVKLLKNFKKDTPLIHAVYDLAERRKNPSVLFPRLLKEYI